MRDIPACKWLDQWTELAQKYEPPPFSCIFVRNMNVHYGMCVTVSILKRKSLILRNLK